MVYDSWENHKHGLFCNSFNDQTSCETPMADRSRVGGSSINVCRWSVSGFSGGCYYNAAAKHATSPHHGYETLDFYPPGGDPEQRDAFRLDMSFELSCSDFSPEHCPGNPTPNFGCKLQYGAWSPPPPMPPFAPCVDNGAAPLDMLIVIDESTPMTLDPTTGAVLSEGSQPHDAMKTLVLKLVNHYKLGEDHAIFSIISFGANRLDKHVSESTKGSRQAGRYRIVSTTKIEQIDDAIDTSDEGGANAVSKGLEEATLMLDFFPRAGAQTAVFVFTSGPASCGCPDACTDAAYAAGCPQPHPLGTCEQTIFPSATEQECLDEVEAKATALKNHARNPKVFAFGFAGYGQDPSATQTHLAKIASDPTYIAFANPSDNIASLESQLDIVWSATGCAAP